MAEECPALELVRPWAIALAVGIVSVGFLAVYTSHHAGSLADFDHLHTAARLVVHGQNPYPLIGPRRQYPNRFPLYYPLPAILVLTPLAPIPLAVARYVFVLIVGSVLGYALAVAGGTRWRYAMLASRQYVECVLLVHWTPLFYAMWTMPMLASLSVIKPTVGVAIVAARGKRRMTWFALWGALALGAVSFLIQPNWVPMWWHEVSKADTFSPPILRPGGIFLLLALFRWRRPEARLLFALALPPQTPSFYDPLLIFLVASSSIEVMTLVVAGHALDYWLALRGPFATTHIALAAVARFGMWFLYLPALVMVLRRPNEGPVPPALERLAARLPRWIGGRQLAVATPDKP